MHLHGSRLQRIFVPHLRTLRPRPAMSYTLQNLTPRTGTPSSPFPEPIFQHSEQPCEDQRPLQRGALTETPPLTFAAVRPRVPNSCFTCYAVFLASRLHSAFGRPSTRIFLQSNPSWCVPTCGLQAQHKRAGCILELFWAASRGWPHCVCPESALHDWRDDKRAATRTKHSEVQTGQTL